MYLLKDSQNVNIRPSREFDAKLRREGLQLGDSLTIRPFYGREKKINILRTKVDFNLDNEFSHVLMNSQKGLSFQIPSLYKVKKNYQLILYYDSKSPNDEEKARYCFKSNNQYSFTINGVQSFESFIERGDRIVIDHNLFIFGSSIHKYNKIENILKHTILDNKKIINSILPILIEGESGTGKSYLARQIHEESGRGGKFVHVNLSSFSPTLIESEIFGHTKGSFTGAICDKRGAIQEAHRGTLFLDEIDSIPKSIQVKLLLFFDSKMIRPVGGGHEVKCDIRLITASGKSLNSLVKNKNMRDDFYYRVTSGVKINLIPLREMNNIIYDVCNSFSCANDVSFSSRVLDFYTQYSWPGNIRQLLSHLEKKTVMTKGRKIDYDQIDEALISEESLKFLRRKEEEYFSDLQKYKFNYILNAFYYFDKNVEMCAKILNVSGNTIRNILRKNNINL